MEATAGSEHSRAESAESERAAILRIDRELRGLLWTELEIGGVRGFLAEASDTLLPGSLPGGDPAKNGRTQGRPRSRVRDRESPGIRLRQLRLEGASERGLEGSRESTAGELSATESAMTGKKVSAIRESRKETRDPGLWERAKGTFRALGTIMILAAAGWIIYKFKKR